MKVDPGILGVWQLDPTRLDYGSQPAPRAGIYTILEDEEAGRLCFHVRWTDADGQVRQTGFVAHPDGAPRELPGTAQSLTTRVEAGRLITELYEGERLVHGAVRTLAEGGDELEVVQDFATPSGVARTRAMYARADVKQVMVYRRDLKMRKGKIAAQVAHASMAVFFRRDRGPIDELVVPLDGPMAAWAKGRFGKVVLSVETEEDLLTVHREARTRGLPTALITDAGLTEFGGVPTRTAVAVGPAATGEIDPITGREGLVPTKLA